MLIIIIMPIKGSGNIIGLYHNKYMHYLHHCLCNCSDFGRCRWPFLSEPSFSAIARQELNLCIYFLYLSNIKCESKSECNTSKLLYVCHCYLFFFNHHAIYYMCSLHQKDDFTHKHELHSYTKHTSLSPKPKEREK